MCVTIRLKKEPWVLCVAMAGEFDAFRRIWSDWSRLREMQQVELVCVRLYAFFIFSYITFECRWHRLESVEGRNTCDLP